MAKTKISLSAAPKAPKASAKEFPFTPKLKEQHDTLLAAFVGCFGTPQEKIVNTDELYYTWDKGNIMWFIYPNGKCDVHLEQDDGTQTKNDGITFDRAKKVMIAYGQKYAAKLQKEIEKLQKQQSKYLDIEYAFSHVK